MSSSAVEINETSAPDDRVARNTADMRGSGEYKPLNSFDILDEPRRTRVFGINRKALLSFLAVVIVALTIVVLTVIFVVYKDSGSGKTEEKERRDEKRFQFADMFNGKFSPDMPDETWISDTSVLRVDERSIIAYNVATETSHLLFQRKVLEDKGIDYEDSRFNRLSPDGNWMLFAVDVKKKYRYSTEAKYYAVNKETLTTIKISTPEATTMSVIQYISWGTSHNSLVFVSGNDVYWMESVEQLRAVRITSTGIDKIMFNGIPDWVYEEEILGERPAVVVAPDDGHVCFASFNDTHVPLFKIALYGKPPTAYTRIQDIAYPKPGTKNPDVHIYVYDVTTGNTVEIHPPAEMQSGDYYFTNLVWADNQTVSVTWLNRAQNKSVVMLCKANNGFCFENYRRVEWDGWVYEYPDPLFSALGDFYIQVLPKYEGEDVGDFLHIAKVSATENGGKNIKFLTAGQWEVKKLVSFDQNNGIVYYESTEESPTKAHLYSVDLNGKKTCLSCALNETKDGRCTNYYSSFSKQSSWFILTCSGPGVPISWFRSTRDNTVKIFESNEDLQKIVEMTEMPTYKYHVIKTSDQKYDILVRETRPSNFNKNKKYAVLFDVYGGPGSQQISETFQAGYHAYLTSNYDIIVCAVDGRGTASRGRKFVHSVYKQLGEFEKNDTLAAARFMQSRQYVEANRISIWGWSYGGFLTSYILSTQESQVFQSGVAVAPVTDWRYYDSVYTERYMGFPDESDNLIGYKFASVLNHAANIPDDSFLLVHGTGDDNVHFQNSAQLIEVMTEAGVKFEMQIYTDKHHSLEGLNIHRHLYHLLTNFFKDKLKL